MSTLPTRQDMADGEIFAYAIQDLELDPNSEVATDALDAWELVRTGPDESLLCALSSAGFMLGVEPGEPGYPNPRVLAKKQRATPSGVMTVLVMCDMVGDGAPDARVWVSGRRSRFARASLSEVVEVFTASDCIDDAHELLERLL